jgi:hypothetical protein
MIVAAVVWPEPTVGMREASATRRPAIPCTRRAESTTAMASRRGSVQQRRGSLKPFLRHLARPRRTLGTGGPPRAAPARGRGLQPASREQSGNFWR